MTCLRHRWLRVSRRGSLLAALAAGFVVLSLGIGQALCGNSDHRGAGVDHAVALCLIVATVATAAAFASPPARQQLRIPHRLSLPPTPAPAWSFVPIARVSPVWLRRFLN